jgi:hypothetical protein
MFLAIVESRIAMMMSLCGDREQYFNGKLALWLKRTALVHFGAIQLSQQSARQQLYQT